MQNVLIHNQSRPEAQPLRAESTASFFGRLRGLMFRPALDPRGGLLMIQPRADRVDSAIHMFFMRFDITVVWADPQLRVVDVQLARRWRPAYAPVKAAKYVLEIHAGRLNDYTIGDQLVIEPC